MTTDRARPGLITHGAAASAAVLALPWAHMALLITTESRLPTGGGYALVWTCFGIAWLLHRRKPHSLIWLFAMWLALLTAVTDLPVVQNTITELTGARW